MLVQMVNHYQLFSVLSVTSIALDFLDKQKLLNCNQVKKIITLENSQPPIIPIYCVLCSTFLLLHELAPSNLKVTNCEVCQCCRLGKRCQSQAGFAAKLYRIIYKIYKYILMSHYIPDHGFEVQTT